MKRNVLLIGGDNEAQSRAYFFHIMTPKFHSLPQKQQTDREPTLVWMQSIFRVLEKYHGIVKYFGFGTP